MHILKKILMLAIAGLFIVLTGCRSPKGVPYVVEEQGRSTLRATFDRKQHTPAEQWQFAKETRDRGNLKKSEGRMIYLYRRWPNSKEAPWAARARADMLFERKKWKDAFPAYQFLIDNYSSRMNDYDSVLENQFAISEKIMNRRRVRWLFGGFRAPEYAVEYFETVIRNGPQWERAPEAQFMIGKCHQDAEQLELAVSAYGVLGYRYPDSKFSEEAAWEQIACLRLLQEEFPANAEILDRIKTATTVFISTYPRSKYKGSIIEIRNELYETKADRVVENADFYANVPKEIEAAILYYEKMVEEYPKSRMVPYAKERIVELKKILAKPIKERTPDIPRSKPLPFVKDAAHVES